MVLLMILWNYLWLEKLMLMMSFKKIIFPHDISFFLISKQRFQFIFYSSFFFLVFFNLEFHFFLFWNLTLGPSSLCLLLWTKRSCKMPYWATCGYWQDNIRYFDWNSSIIFFFNRKFFFLRFFNLEYLSYIYEHFLIFRLILSSK